jgi:hypothetical protein
MEPGSSQSDTLAENNAPDKIGHLIGTLIALLTLAFPIFLIGYFSSSANPGWQPANSLLQEPRN